MVGASSSKRAAQKVDESDYEEDVFVRLLLKEQQAATANPPPTKSRNAVVDAFVGKSKNQNGLKPNTAFLNRIVQDTNSHNRALLKKEALDAVAKLRDFNKTNPIANDRSRSERAPITFERARGSPQLAAAERSTPSAVRISSDESRTGYISDESTPSSNESHERSRVDAHRSKRMKARKSEHGFEHSEERSRSDRRRHHSTARLERPSDDEYGARIKDTQHEDHKSKDSRNSGSETSHRTRHHHHLHHSRHRSSDRADRDRGASDRHSDKHTHKESHRHHHHSSDRHREKDERHRHSRTYTAEETSRSAKEGSRYDDNEQHASRSKR